MKVSPTDRTPLILYRYHEAALPDANVKSSREVLGITLAATRVRESTYAEKEKFGGLTAREREVPALIAKGKSNHEIAEAMRVGVKTIETYIARILNKLGFD